MRTQREMRLVRWQSSGAAIVAVLLGLCSVALAEGNAGHPPLPGLQQILRHFDFEEPDAAPNALPSPFYRHLAPTQGYPPFGAMRLTKTVAYSGQGSFEFELGGGSMSARIPAAVIPVLPLTDYAVSVKVRTEGLTHAGARLSAWLFDKTGEIIPESRAQSRTVQTQGEWETLTVEIHSRREDAADLALDLQVVQASYLSGKPADPDQPRLEDISGHVWFDDVVVSHLPHVRLDLKEPGRMVVQPNVPEFQIALDELASEPLKARLRVLDLDGRIVFDSTFPAPRGPQPGSTRVPLQRCGWYRAWLQITGSDGVRRQQWLDFVVAPPPRRGEIHNKQFGVVLPDASPQAFAEIPLLIDQLNCGWATVPIWSRQTLPTREQPRAVAIRQTIETLLHENIDLIFSLDVVPDALARTAGVETHQVLELLEKDSRIWHPYLDELLVNFGLEVNRWQVGAADQAHSVWLAGLRSAAETAQRSLAEFVPKPILHTAWSLDQEMVPEESLSAYAVSVPSEISPASIEEYLKPFVERGASTYANLQLLPTADAAGFSARSRVIDAMIRGLYAWRSGLPIVNIPAPWHADPYRNDRLTPEPVFAAWRTLASMLDERTFVGELPGSQGVHCWMLRGQRRNDSLLIVWTDAVGPSRTQVGRSLDLQLAAGPVNITDAFGNTGIITPSEGIHHVPLTELPCFIENANLNLVQFRGGVQIDPTFVPAVSKMHDHHLVLHNPWDVAVSGTIRLGEDDDWKLTPIAQEFTIHAGGEVRLPLTIIPQRSIVAGRKQIPATINITADQAYTLNVHLNLDVGLENIVLTASWSVAQNPITGEEDLIVSQVVTNHGTAPVNLDVYILADGLSQTRRTIAALGAGETAVRTFHIANGFARFAGQQIRVGVAERDGLTRLNRMLAIPAKLQ